MYYYVLNVTKSPKLNTKILCTKGFSNDNVKQF